MFGMHQRVMAAILACTTLLASGADAQAQLRQTLQWRRAAKTFDANLTGHPLVNVLEDIRRQTGWEVFYDPGLRIKVDAEFTGKRPGDALKLMLGNTPYTLAPSIKGATKLYVFRSNRDQATERIEAGKDKARPIPNELILVLKKDRDGKALAAQYNADILGFIASHNAYRLRFKDAKAAEQARALIEANGDWGDVDHNYAVERPEAIEPVRGGAVPGLKLNLENLGKGNAVIIGMIDTGVQAQGMSHAEFLLPSIEIAGQPVHDPKVPSHGTTMAETMIRGLSQSGIGANDRPVQILPVDVYGSSELTSTFDVARGITAAVNAGAPIVNLSLGGTGNSVFLHNVIKNCHDQGVLFLGAAGNEPVTTPTYPAAYPEVMAITATDRTGGIASYANRGDFIDVAAPGATLVNYDKKSWHVTGTSAATAYMAGVAAGLTSRSNKSPTQVGEGIINVMGLKKK